ncbi:PAS domain-containing sensor histidine kinase [Pelovirga terrestris]|uniref:histidine kinase n=1 Tax=Pelovirga terrestris TaxID=2771352 RepID=A0A8J6R0B3_9BACT|nr:PAS domain S-box protein [Pelovirga terrestris]MBD1401832.1 PAS domain S-box protein [Pelovirga terrestris]
MPAPVDPHLQQLRLKAEERLHQLAGSNPDDQQGIEILHELRVYQAELELQNQQLRETQQQLQQTLERFNALYHRSPIGYVTIDNRGQIQELNDSFATMLGYPAGNLRHKYLASYCSSDSADVLRQRLPAFCKSPQGKILDLSLINNAGDILLVEVQGQKLPGEECLACNVIDRTERKLAEAAGKDSQAQLRAVTSAARNAILMMNSHGLVTFCNPACKQVLGYAPQELLGQPLHELLAPEHYLPDYHPAIKEFQVSGKGNAIGKTTDLKARHKSGELLDVELSLSAVAIKGEWHAVGIIRDITQTKRTEQELKLSKDRLKNWYHLMKYIIHHDPNGIAVFDRNLHFLFVSDRFVREYRVNRKDLIGKHHYEVFPDIPEKWRAIHQRALSGEILAGDDDEFVREDGQKDYTRWSCCPWYEIDGTIGGIVLYSEVITERKQMEQALTRRTAELEQRTEELERFNYTVSHDLKSPLVTVKTFLGFLEQDMRAGDTEKIDQDIDHIRTATDRMSMLLEDLLSLSRLGWVADQPEKVSLNGLLEHTLMLVQGQIQESGAQIRLVDTDLFLHADPSRLLEVWQNLIDNALTYGITDNNPYIDIGLESGPEPVFYIRDYGPGIPKEFHQKVFGLFEKLDRNSKGSGLGLALVKRIVAKHGGNIWVESSGDGQGCCFKFTLPAAYIPQ